MDDPMLQSGQNLIIPLFFFRKFL